MPHRWLRITLSFQLRQKLKFHMLITMRKISDAKTHVQNSEFQTKKTPCLHHCTESEATPIRPGPFAARIQFIRRTSPQPSLI